MLNMLRRTRRVATGVLFVLLGELFALEAAGRARGAGKSTGGKFHSENLSRSARKRTTARIVGGHEKSPSEKRPKTMIDSWVIKASLEGHAPVGGVHSERRAGQRNGALQKGHKSSLPIPSPEQDAVIHALRSGDCVAVSAVAGSGKTTCILQAAAELTEKQFLIVTYNRALRDECNARIKSLGLQDRVSVYTIHGLVSKCSRKNCRSDVSLNEIVEEWDREQKNSSPSSVLPLEIDVVLLDEAQDLRPSFYTAICHILRSRKHSERDLQMGVIGDPKQLLYSYPTLGLDKATEVYLTKPEQLWQEHTNQRRWVHLNLSVSYRLTPKTAAFINSIWGTEIVGANTADPDLPVTYLCRVPYPEEVSPDHLHPSFFADLINDYGSQNVMFLAQSVKAERCPIKNLVNQLGIEDESGRPKCNFHVKDNQRVKSQKADDLANKVRVWTFCSSKGCEADVVVVFGFSCWRKANMVDLNQMGVALSRAKKRLIVIHDRESKESREVKDGSGLPIRPPVAFYPILGGTAKATTKVGEETWVVPDDFHQRSTLTQDVLAKLTGQGVVRGDDVPCPPTLRKEEHTGKQVLLADKFTYFAANEQKHFLDMGEWFAEDRKETNIQFEAVVQFEQTKEDVSAIYSTAVVIMVQYELLGACPQIEAIIDPRYFLRFDPFRSYNSSVVSNMIQRLHCDRMSKLQENLLSATWPDEEAEEYDGPAVRVQGVRGSRLITLFNTEILLRKTIKSKNGRKVVFNVKAMAAPEQDLDEDADSQIELMLEAYEDPAKTPADWCFMATGLMALGSYHEQWKQIGSDRKAYRGWVDAAALVEGAKRLKRLLGLGSQPPPEAFEHPLGYSFDETDEGLSACLTCRGKQVVGIVGSCDWFGSGLQSPSGRCVQLTSVAFAQDLGNEEKMQLLVLCALSAAISGEACAGLLYNARTTEAEVCVVGQAAAEALLTNLAIFKTSGSHSRVPPDRQADQEIKVQSSEEDEGKDEDGDKA